MLTKATAFQPLNVHYYIRGLDITFFLATSYHPGLCLTEGGKDLGTDLTDPQSTRGRPSPSAMFTSCSPLEDFSSPAVIDFTSDLRAVNHYVSTDQALTCSAPLIKLDMVYEIANCSKRLHFSSDLCAQTSIETATIGSGVRVVVAEWSTLAFDTYESKEFAMHDRRRVVFDQ
ncbi:hypothetical protein EVAR_98055_1 [Eumeta japonica]|uniref:Uncharacterized protein n=1 Tax=Eumeta variegata TaxID=151549 RepID=A0A4C1WCR5_EUMVA|nr:hypothetical protein EVAR_98055_1 [Eumeta japonica]